ncbi:hypothetical protein [Frateuria sp.]|uniref:hypothetical protein n=1 Tax=Frateuria sp. TaxID=2211372 RepID=UPI003F7E24DF
MLAKKHICVVALCLATVGFQSEGLGEPGPSPTGSPYPQQSSHKEPDTALRHGLKRNDLTTLRYRDTTGKWNNRTTELWNDGITTLPELREKLAEEWQRLGVPAEQAKVIAAAFRGSDRRMVRNEPLKGKSAEDVAAMMQSALASKDYRQANLLLIDYERAQLNLDQMDTSTPGPR